MKRFRVMIRDDETQGLYDLGWFLMKLDMRVKSLEEAMDEMREYPLEEAEKEEKHGTH